EATPGRPAKSGGPGTRAIKTDRATEKRTRLARVCSARMKGTNRALLTGVFGLCLVIWFWLVRQEPSPYALVHSTPFQVPFLALIVIVPLVVGRWWVVLALA